MQEVRPKKALGQHFLTDQNIAKSIVEQLSPDVETVIEVGAGTGVLTQYMVNDIRDKFYVIEIDKESIAYLQKHFPMLGNRLIEGDFLRADLSQFGQQNMAIIGNFPYNISSQIFFQVLKYKEQVVEVVGMVQKEMAERMAAKDTFCIILYNIIHCTLYINIKKRPADHSGGLSLQIKKTY